jgi:lipopolysaccharide heptosyltransferase III
LNSEAGSQHKAGEIGLDWSLVKRVLLVRLRSIGDTVLMTPCLSALKNWRPDVEIVVLSEPLAAPVIADHPFVDKLVVTESSLASRASLITSLRNARIDIAFNMHGGPTGAIISRLVNAKSSVGYRGLRLSWLLSDRAPSPDLILGRSQIHSVEQQLALISWAGVPWPEKFPVLTLASAPETRAQMVAKLSDVLGINWNQELERGYGCVVPGAAFDSKQWTTEGFAAVADHLVERWNLPCFVVAGPGQEKLAHDVAAVTRNKTTVVSGLQLKELVALLEMSRIFVGNDSGPMHIAAALNRPVVAVWGSSNPMVWHPWTEAPWRIVNGMQSIQEGPGLPIAQIPPADVIAAIDGVLEQALEANHSAVGRLTHKTNSPLEA